MPMKTMFVILGRHEGTEARRHEVGGEGDEGGGNAVPAAFPFPPFVPSCLRAFVPSSSTRFNSTTCSTICAEVRFPFTPFTPLAQNLHPTGQPTCELTHAVLRSASGIITVS